MNDFHWERVAGLGGRAERIQALAVDSGGGIVLGDEAGVGWMLGNADAVADFSSERLRASVVGVKDLVVDAGGQAWIAAETGLYRWSLEGRPVRRDLRGGEAANRITRVFVLGRRVVVATEAGAYWSSTGAIFQSLSSGGVSQPISLIAIVRPGLKGAARGSGADSMQAPNRESEVWLYGPQGLTRIGGIETPNGFRVTRRERLALPVPRSEAVPVDLIFDAFSGQIVLVYPDRFAIRTLQEGHRAAKASEPWRIHQPVLAPGARISRIAIFREVVVAATDRGLFESEGLTGAFHRVGAASAGAACHAVATGSSEDGEGIIAACGATLYRRVRAAGSLTRRDAGLRETAFIPREPIPKDPPLAALRQRALANAGLDRGREERLWAGLRRRGWWPDLSIRAGVDFDRDDRRHSDQSFLSGETRYLLDRTRDQAKAYDASVQLDWSLGEVAYPSDAVDFSRELRQRLSLRDDVSDEIHQLYFERERLRALLASDVTLTEEEARAARSRAEELAAGLDAWTGGWLSRWRADSSKRAALGDASEND